MKLSEQIAFYNKKQYITNVIKDIPILDELCLDLSVSEMYRLCKLVMEIINPTDQAPTNGAAAITYNLYTGGINSMEKINKWLEENIDQLVCKAKNPAFI